MKEQLRGFGIIVFFIVVLMTLPLLALYAIVREEREMRKGS